MIGRDPFDAWLDEREAELLAEKGEAPKGYSLPNGWSPRPYQEPVWRFLNNGGKRACLIWHRRAGKDSLASIGLR
jgi:hypothetical protein